MKELKIGCGKPTGAKVGESAGEQNAANQPAREGEVAMSIVRVGQKAPDFEAPAYNMIPERQSHGAGEAGSRESHESALIRENVQCPM